MDRWARIEVILLFLVLGLLSASPWISQPTAPTPVRYPDGSGIGA